MLHGFAISLLAIASAAMSESPKITPTFSLVEDKSIDGSPSIIINFPNGESDTLLLEKYYANEDDRGAIHQTILKLLYLSCNYQLIISGHI